VEGLIIFVSTTGFWFVASPLRVRWFSFGGRFIFPEIFVVFRLFVLCDGMTSGILVLLFAFPPFSAGRIAMASLAIRPAFFFPISGYSFLLS